MGDAARSVMKAVPLGAAIFAAMPVAYAQEAEPEAAEDEVGLQEVVVSAQKRDENLQDVPIAVTALSTEVLEQRHIGGFDDYAKFLPSLSYTSFGPGFARTIMRGVSSGDNGNHSGPLPTVGTYLDEQSVTTIQGALDVHLYDIARVEALAGPQGTLYGASSQAGTIRIITNKPELARFEAGYDLEGSMLSGEGGYTAEGFANFPLGDRAAIRLVGWSVHSPGYIDNIPGSITYPAAGITINNADIAKKNFNDVDTFGGRAALKIDLNDNWTVTPTVMAQKTKANGVFNFDPALGDLKVVKFRPDKSEDRFVQAALTVEGKVGNFDVTYAGAFLKRGDETDSDYTDYSYFYDVTYGYVWYGDDDSIIDSTQYIQGKDRYQRWSHEVRFATPSDWRVRFVGGVFIQRQQHGIQQRYKIDNLRGSDEVQGWDDTIWLTEQFRVDRDRALFGEVSFDITPTLTATAGGRAFKADNSLRGFFGYSDSYSSSGRSGEALCSLMLGNAVGDESGWVPFTAVGTAPCTNLDKRVKEDGFSPKVNLTWHVTDDKLLYATWAEGFRPGGVNRRGTFPPYDSDYLKSFEIGWKTTWWNNRLRLNGAVFTQKWNDFQFSFTGANGLTNVINAGSARIDGIETEIEWAATDSLTLTGGAALLDPKLAADFCEQLDEDGNPLSRADCDPGSFAADGTTLPTTPKFKANMTGRYTFNVADFDAHFQASFVYQGKSRSALLPYDTGVIGDQPAYGLVDLATGVERDNYSIELFVANAFDKRAEQFRFVQCDEIICKRPFVGTAQPRTIGIKFSQKF